MTGIHVRFRIALLFGIMSTVALAQDVAASGVTLGSEAVPPVSDPAFVLRSVSYSIEGRTREYYLDRAADFDIGMTFADRTALDAYIEDRRQLIVNERVIESVEIEMSMGETAPGEPVPVALAVRTVDTWNIIALPYFRYDSNTGLLLSARVRDYDFFGTMEPLRVNFNYEQDLSGETTFGADMDFSLPFPAFGLDWEWSLGSAVALPIDQPVDASLGGSLALYVPVRFGKLRFSIQTTGYLNNRTSSGNPYLDSFYFFSGAKVAWSLPLFEMDKFGAVTLAPRLDLTKLWIPGATLQDTRLSPHPILTPGADLSFGRIDWIGNFRQGLSASLSSSFGIDLVDDSPSLSITGEAAGYLALGCLGPAARLSGFWYAYGNTDDAPGEALRGILNRRATSDAAVVLNLDLPFRVFRFTPSSWFGVSWMRYFDFEQQVSLFADLALGHYDGRWFDPRDGWYAAGLETITFPFKMRSIYLRISLGWNIADVAALRALSGASPRDGAAIRELFIGFGHHY